jgi:thiol-disulfide isomerase/thioredoxin
MGAVTLVFLVVACGIRFAAAAPPLTALRGLIRPGENAPAFTLNDIDGKRVSYRPSGKSPSLIVFWSAFCPLCRELTPSLNDLSRRHAASIRIVGVNLDGKRFSHSIKAFVKEYAVSYPVLLDDIRSDFFIASDPYGVEKTPTAVIVDTGGKVRAAYAGDGMRVMFADFDGILSGLKDGPGVKK